jgi:hypothetical protein
VRQKHVLEYLRQQSKPVDSSDVALDKWHAHEDALDFLRRSVFGDVPVCCVGRFLVFSLVLPEENLRGNYVEDLLGWNFSIDTGYGYGLDGSNESLRAELHGPMSWTSTGSLNGSEPVFFLRSSPLVRNGKLYAELNQVVSQVLDIHWTEREKAWCRIDDLGDVIAVARVHYEDELTVCTLAREDLDRYLYIANSCLVRVFDVARISDSDVLYGTRSSPAGRKKYEEDELYATHTVVDQSGRPGASYLRGVQIVRCSRPASEMLTILQGKGPREYAMFLIWDWKNKRVCEWSSNPDQLGNYFVSSDLPFETSPAFFKPDVLMKYRNDPDKYTIEERRIRCRGAWSLEYDRNEEAQVHAYICDLGRLPYQEQIYWKSYNEQPRAGISARALTTDFDAEWDLSYDPLRSLKDVLASFPQVDCQGKPCSIWRMSPLPKTRDLDYLGYVVTQSRKEWEDQMQCLAQLLVDGLNAKYINRLAATHDCRDEKLGSGKQLAKVLETLGEPEGQVRELMAPLAELWDYRIAIAHPGDRIPDSDFGIHFRDLLERCDHTMRTLAEMAASGRLTLNPE